MDGLAYGFMEVVNIKHLKNIDIPDLELILNGTQEIDLADWRSNTEYRGGYFDSHENIELFWEYITKLSNGKYKTRSSLLYIDFIIQRKN